MPKIDISSATKKRLQDNSVPLDDTYDTIINSALDALESKGEQAKLGRSQNVTKTKKEHIEIDPMEIQRSSRLPEMKIDPHNLPDVSNTKVLSVKVEGLIIDKPRWKKIVYCLLETARNRELSVTDLISRFSIRLVSGVKSDKGYRYISSSNMSVPPLSAQESCEIIVNLAESLNVNVDVKFEWYAKLGASYPGRKARLRI